MKNIANILIVFLSIFCTPCNAFFPSKTIGQGHADLSDARLGEQILPGRFVILGTARFLGYSSRTDEVVPDGMLYLSFYTDSNVRPEAEYCTDSGPAFLCNFRVQPGDPLSKVIDIINSKAVFNFPWGYNTWTDGAGRDICSMWVLSATMNASSSQYGIGRNSCGIAMPDVECTISPTAIVLDMGTVKNGTTAHGGATTSILCEGGDASVQVKITGSAGVQGAIIVRNNQGEMLPAQISLNGNSASQGITLHVNNGQPTMLSISGSVRTTADSSGYYQGSSTLELTYL